MAPTPNYSTQNNLPVWNLAQLFPEGGDLRDISTVTARVKDFYEAREHESHAIKQAIEQAVAQTDAVALADALEKSAVVHLEMQRVRDFCYLFQQMQPDNPEALALKTNNVAWYDKAFTPLNQASNLLEKQPPALVQQWQQEQPMIKELDKLLGIWDKEQFAKPQTLEQRQALHPLRLEKYALQNEYLALHQQGVIKASNQEAREKIAALFNKLGQLNWKIISASGVKTPMHMFAAHEYISPEHLEHLWYSTNRLSETSDQISELLEQSFGGKKEALKSWRDSAQSKKYSWEEARSLITEALSTFHPDLKPILDEAFENGWIHAAPRTNSMGNAFTMPGISRNLYRDGHPYILAEFDGSLEKLVTLAHELGHACSHVLAQKNGCVSGAHSTLMQESFAVMSETLVLHHMLRQAETPLDRAMVTRAMLKRTQSAIFSQIGHVNFENAVHNAAAQNKSLSSSELDTLWQQSMVHTGLPNNADASNGWANVHHYFSHDPYYMMGYVMAGLSANALANRWQQSTPENRQALANNWMDIMRSGTHITPEHMLERMGIALDSSFFYHNNRQYFHGLMGLYRDSMEALSTRDLPALQTVGQPQLESGKQFFQQMVGNVQDLSTRAVNYTGRINPYFQPNSITSSAANGSRTPPAGLPNFADRVQDARLVSDSPLRG